MMNQNELEVFKEEFQVQIDGDFNQEDFAALKAMSDEVLLSNFDRVVRSERKITFEVLCYIIEVEERRLYAFLGYNSMNAFLIKEKKYAGGSAQRRLQAAKLLKDLPELSVKIQQGSVNLTQLNQLQVTRNQQDAERRKARETAVTPLLTEAQETGSDGAMASPLDSAMEKEAKLAEQRAAIAKIENKNTFETAKILSEVFDVPLKIHEVVKPQKDGSVRIEATFSEHQFNKLKTCRDIFSHAKHNTSYADVIDLMMDFVIAKKSPGREVRSYKKKTTSREVGLQDLEVGSISLDAEPAYLTQSRTAKVRESISPSLRSQVYQRDRCCQFQSPLTRIKCGSTKLTQVDHIVPVARGGKSVLENLRLLCRAHNLSEAKRLGILH
jgi:hypothetical protein